MNKAQSHQVIANLLAILEYHLPNEYLVSDSGLNLELSEFGYCAIKDTNQFIEFQRLGGNYSVILNQNWSENLVGTKGISFCDMKVILNQ